MPVDDLVTWAAERTHGGSLRTDDDTISPASADEPQPLVAPRVPIRRAPSPRPKLDRLPRWYDIGHCPAACSGRCSLHAPKQEQQHVANDTNSCLPGAASSLRTHRRSHRGTGQPGFQNNDAEELRLSSTPKSKASERKSRHTRLDLAREALLNGNADLARAIVAEETERLGI